jgi:hypothetical protein
MIAGRGLLATAPVAAGTTLTLDPEQLNHSCDPNLGWSGDVQVVIRAVAAGEELTLDYATFVHDARFTMFCHCETYRCRQVIEGTDWQIPQLQARYAGRWAPAVQRRIDATPR